MIDANHLEFGDGDIGIHMGDTSDVALLVFRNMKKSAPIGWLLSGTKAKEVVLEDSDVVMSFTNTESIDAYSKGCLFKRNRYLVDNADLLLATFDGQPGRTAMTVEYAKKTGTPVSVISP